MLNILKLKKFNNKSPDLYYTNNSLNTNNTKEKNINENNNNHIMEEYNNVIYRPIHSKEWYNSVYSFNKSYTKPLVALDVILNNLFKNYCNMLQYKLKSHFKRRRHSKTRYTANRLYVSRAEVKHYNNKLTIMVYTYNKNKSLLERYLKKLILTMRLFNLRKESDTYLLTRYKKKTCKILKLHNMYWKTKVRDPKSDIKIDSFYAVKNKSMNFIKNKIFVLNKWNMTFFRFKNNLLKFLLLKLKKNDLFNIPTYNIRLLKKKNKLKNRFFYYAKSITFNRSKFNNLILNLRNLGLINLIHKIYDKKIEIKVIELKSLHLNSDVFSAAIALKLKDRKNKAIRVLISAINQMVKVPDLHTLLTFDEKVETINKNNVVKTIKQQVVSGVRFEASGRLTKRLTAMRAIFKYRYIGSLKNLRASYDNKASAMSRGHMKSNSQYTLINSKTRNGTFGLKGWVSSH